MAAERIRRAVVSGHHSIEEVNAYLPFNYQVSIGPDGQVYIEGHDYAGWTLDDYIIPRLQSGLIAAQEVAEGSNA